MDGNIFKMGIHISSRCSLSIKEEDSFEHMPFIGLRVMVQHK